MCCAGSSGNGRLSGRGPRRPLTPIILHHFRQKTMVLRPLRKLGIHPAASIEDAWLERIEASLKDPALDRPRFCREILNEFAYPEYAASWETAVQDVKL